MNDELRARIIAYNAAKKAVETERDSLSAQLTELQDRLTAMGGIDAAETLAAWKADAIAKINTLPTLTRATVKKLLGLE